MTLPRSPVARARECEARQEPAQQHRRCARIAAGACRARGVVCWQDEPLILRAHAAVDCPRLSAARRTHQHTHASRSALNNGKYIKTGYNHFGAIHSVGCPPDAGLTRRSGSTAVANPFAAARRGPSATAGSGKRATAKQKQARRHQNKMKRYAAGTKPLAFAAFTKRQ